MEFAWIVFAFVCGFFVKLAGLPPLIGFLAAGFALNVVGVQPNDTLEALANLGITLMLFTIGLKLDARDLLKREVWAGTLMHMVLWTAVVTGILVVLSVVALPLFAGVDLRTAALLAFALSFSSTVCIIKILEENGEIRSRHGRLAVGILVMQDIVAVLFLVAATGKLPSPWAVGLLGLVFARPLLSKLLHQSGHGELLPLTGFLFALGGYELFSALGVKGDLGALVLGMLLSGDRKASELAKSLMSFKDLFLVGFFLSIGLSALPDWEMVFAAVALCAVLAVKIALFFVISIKLRLRARTSFLSSLVLSNYSEFGLIVVFVCVKAGWLTQDWLVVLALAVSLSFAITALVYRFAHRVYTRYKLPLRGWEHATPLPGDQVYRPSSAEILVIGTGRVGLGAFRALHDSVGDRVWGMDADRERIAAQVAQGMHVFAADAESADVWDSIDVSAMSLVLLAVASIEDCRNIAEQLKAAGYAGPIAAIARYEDEREALLNYGIDEVFNFFTEAGAAFAEDSLRLIDAAKVVRSAPVAGTSLERHDPHPLSETACRA
ncbi:MAG: cation:proton antiporter [Pseudomonadota bacterium]